MMREWEMGTPNASERRRQRINEPGDNGISNPVMHAGKFSLRGVA